MKQAIFFLIYSLILSVTSLQSIINFTLLSRNNEPLVFLLSTASNEYTNYTQTHHNLLTSYINQSHHNITIVYELDNNQLQSYDKNGYFASPHFLHESIMMLTQYMFKNRQHQKINWHPCELRAPFITKFINYLCDQVDPNLSYNSHHELIAEYTLHTLSHYLAGSLDRMDDFIDKTIENSDRNKYLIKIKKNMKQTAYTIQNIVDFNNTQQPLSLAITNLNQQSIQTLLDLIISFDDIIVSTAYADYLLGSLAPINEKKIILMLREEYINLISPILLLSNFKKEPKENLSQSFLSSFNQACEFFFV